LFDGYLLITLHKKRKVLNHIKLRPGARNPLGVRSIIV